MRTILSVDGGGVRGIIPLACLVKLESRHGKPCRELFDMVAGTSTGAIIAGGLALGISARGLLGMYRSLAEATFRRLPWWQLLLNLGNHRYDVGFIRRTLEDIGADRGLNSLPIDVLITARNIDSGRTDFFVRDNPGNAQLWGTMSLLDALLGSIAAPTYFPAHSATVLGKDYTWVDGGVGVNGNPSYQTAVEAIHYSEGKYRPGETRLLSFGTGRSPDRIDAGKASILGWAQWVFGQVFDDAGEWQAFVTRREYGLSGRIDFRRYQLALTPGVMQKLGVEIPPGVDVTKIDLDSVWAVDLLERIGRAFAEKIDFDDPDGLELDDA